MSWPQILGQLAFLIVPVALSAYFAFRARRTERRLQRLRDLEARNAENKWKMYEPMLTAVSDLLTPGRQEEASEQMKEALPDFMMFVAMWGSDEVLDAFFRFRKAADVDPPYQITMRLISDFLLAARRDLAVPETKSTGLQIMGMRIDDLFDQDDWSGLFNDDFDTVCRRFNWTPPWAGV